MKEKVEKNLYQKEAKNLGISGGNNNKNVDREVIDIKKENKFNESLIPIVSEKIYCGLHSAFMEYKGRKQNEDFLNDKSYSKIKTDL